MRKPPKKAWVAVHGHEGDLIASRDQWNEDFELYIRSDLVTADHNMSIAYEKVGEITEHVREVLIGEAADDELDWQTFDDQKRRYSCVMVSPTTMFVLIPPGGFVDRHHDIRSKGRRLNTVLLTNDGCVNYTVKNGLEYSQHLFELGIYQFDATLEHWAVNHGKTDRLVLVETLLEE